MMMFWRELKVVLGWKRVEEGGEREKRGKNRKEEIEENEEDFTGCAGR